jgi:hypothetical protein
MTSVAQTDETVHVHDAMWSQRVMLISDKLHRQFPDELQGRVEAATALALDPSKVQRDAEGVWHVAASKGGWYSVNGTCPCPDFSRAMGNWCKHKIAVNMVHRAHEIPQEDLVIDPATHDQETGESISQDPAPVSGHTEQDDEGTTRRPPSRRTVPAKYIQKLQGKDFVRYAGLLQMAQAEGLVELSAAWTHNEAELSLAHAVALFEDGRRYEESGDSTPQNAKNIGLHWRRQSLTRAKARALRDALGINEVSVEEME